jgi:hypothetical protein
MTGECCEPYPLARFPPTRNPDSEARRPKRRVAAICHRSKRAMTRRRRQRRARAAALFVTVAIGSYATVLLDWL